jgi:hypothetical protein
MKFRINPVYAIRILMETVVADFMLHPEQDQNAASHPDR